MVASEVAMPMAWNSGLQLRVVSGVNKGEVTRLTSKRMTVGRTQTAGSRAEGWVLLSDKTISRRHLELVWADRGRAFTIHHLSRTNSSWLNGESLSEPTVLKIGHQIRLGDSTLVVERATEGEVEEETLPSASPRANWELTETLTTDTIAQAIAAAAAAEKSYTLEITGGLEQGRKVPIQGHYICIGRNSLTAEELFRDASVQPFDQIIELGDPKAAPNHFLLKWSEVDEKFSIQKNPSASAITLGRTIDGENWQMQLTKKSTLLRDGDILALGDSLLEIIPPE